MSEQENSLSYFDRAVGQLHGLPDVVRTKESTQRVVPTFGIGSHVYVVQTFRQVGVGDTIFLETISEGKSVRIVIPPAVAETIARQRDQLTDKSRSRAATRNAEALKERGHVPGFLRKNKGASAR